MIPDEIVVNFDPSNLSADEIEALTAIYAKVAKKLRKELRVQTSKKLFEAITSFEEMRQKLCIKSNIRKQMVEIAISYWHKHQEGIPYKELASRIRGRTPKLQNLHNEAKKIIQACPYAAPLFGSYVCKPKTKLRSDTILEERK